MWINGGSLQLTVSYLAVPQSSVKVWLLPFVPPPVLSFLAGIFSPFWGCITLKGEISFLRASLKMTNHGQFPKSPCICSICHWLFNLSHPNKAISRILPLASSRQAKHKWSLLNQRGGVGYDQWSSAFPKISWNLRTSIYPSLPSGILGSAQQVDGECRAMGLCFHMEPIFWMEY